MSRPTPRVAAWLALGLAGLALAIGIAYAATELVTQHIALSGARSDDTRLVVPPRGDRDRIDTRGSHDSHEDGDEHEHEDEDADDD